jgi:ParB family transcriptional regulator, chromosome partitioning protein
MEKYVIVELPLNKLIFNPRNDRIYGSLIDAKGNIDKDQIGDLIVSMSKLRQQEAVTAAKDGDVYRIISGNRRYATAKVLGWKTIKAVIIDVDQQTEDALIVSSNLNRDKSYSQKLAEYEIYKNYYQINDDDKELKIEGGFTIKNVASKLMQMKPTKFSELLYVSKHRPDLVASIDDGEHSVHSAYTFVKAENDQKEQEKLLLELQEEQIEEENKTLNSSTPDFNLRFDSERKYADTIINTFIKKVKEVKEQEQEKFSLVKLLQESINYHESKLDDKFEEEYKVLSVKFKKMDEELDARKYIIIDWDDNEKEITINISEYEISENLRYSNKGYSVSSKIHLRELVIRKMFVSGVPCIKLRHPIQIDLDKYKLIKNYCEIYIRFLSDKYGKEKEIKLNITTPEKRKTLRHELTAIDKEIRIYLRILLKYTSSSSESVKKSLKGKK